MNMEYTRGKRDFFEIYLRKNADKFYDIDPSSITYSYWQVHEDLSIHLFLKDFVGEQNIEDFYLSSWKLFLEKFNMPCGSNPEEIEAVFREDMEDSEKIEFKNIGVEEFKKIIFSRLNNQLIDIFNENFKINNKFKIFREVTSSKQFIEYLFWDENKIGLLYFM